jgi:hypothetical protein
MPIAPTLKSLLPLVAGLAIGGLGATLFRDSLIGEEGSPEQRVATLEVALKKAENRLIALEGDGRRRSGRTTADGLRDLRDDLAAGRPVTPDDVFRVMQPAMRQLSPLLDRMRVRDQMRRIDSMTGELARKYDLSAAQQESLKAWFRQKAEADAKEWSDRVASDSTTLDDLARASRDMRPDDGLEDFMATQLSGEKLETFRTERMAQRAERVQQEADMRVQRLDGVVQLDDAQRDQVFGIMARSSRDYDPGMRLEGIGGEIGATPRGQRDDAILSVLRPEQREAYQAEKQRRRDQAAAELAEIGLSVPEDWDPISDDSF